jgi:hypothetical protein
MIYLHYTVHIGTGPSVCNAQSTHLTRAPHSEHNVPECTHTRTQFTTHMQAECTTEYIFLLEMKQG